MKRRYTTAQRFLDELVGLALALLFGFFAVLTDERLITRDAAWYVFTLHCWPLVFAYLAGRVSSRLPKKPGQVLVIVVPVLTVAASALLLPPARAAEWLRLAFALIPALLLARIGAQCVPVYPQRYAVASVALSLFDILFFAMAFAYIAPDSPLCICAMVNFLLCLYSANAKGLVEGTYAMETGIPRGLRIRNSLLLAVFLAVTVALAVSGIPQKLIRLVFGAIFAAIRWVTSHFAIAEQEPVGGQVNYEELIEEIPDVEPGASRYIVYTFFGLLVAFLFVMLVLFLYQLLRSQDGRQRKPRRKKEKREVFAENEEEDEIESVFDADEWLGRGREGLGRFFDRFRRAPRFSDIKDDAEKLRYAFRELRTERCLDAPEEQAKTPLELGSEEESLQLKKLTEDYSAMRYGEVLPGAEAGKNAEDAHAQIAKRLRKKRKQAAGT